MRDVIVVGARVAGAATAMLLAREGLDVLVVDRAQLGSDVPHGHFIHRGGPLRLARWGLLDRVLESGTPAVTGFTQDYGEVVLTATQLEVDGVPMGVAPRRARFDRLMVEAAVEAGAEHRERFPVREYLFDGDRVTGVRGPTEERARVVVGADGRNSALARAVRAPLTRDEPTLSCWYFSYFSGVPSIGLEVIHRPGRAIFAFRTDDDLLGVMVSFPAAELPGVRADIDGAFQETIERVPDLAGRMRLGRREERFSGATQLPNFLRRPWGPGWALVGDAGCHKDPYLALGMCDALRDAELLAEALGDGLHGRRPLEEALADYERRRDEATAEEFELNFQVAHLRPLPRDVLDQLAPLQAAPPEVVRRHFLEREGLVPAPVP